MSTSVNTFRMDSLQKAIDQRVGDLNERPNEPQKYAELVKLGLKHSKTVPAEQFRKRLLLAGLSRPRASEIKVILKHKKEVAVPFIQGNTRSGGKVQRPGVRWALEEARSIERKERNEAREKREREERESLESEETREVGGGQLFCPERYFNERRRARRAILRALKRLLEERVNRARRAGEPVPASWSVTCGPLVIDFQAPV